MTMEPKETVYTAPKEYSELPSEIVALLSGDHIDLREGEAIRLSTVGEDGWPHAAQLSIGEVLSINPSELLVATWHDSHTANNLKRDGRLTLSLVAGGGLLEMRGRAALAAEDQTLLKLSVFRVKVEKISEHRSSYADVVSGVTFKLHDSARTTARWRDQIDMLKTLV